MELYNFSEKTNIGGIKMKKSLIIVSSALVLGLGLAGCSSSDSASKKIDDNSTKSTVSNKPTETNKPVDTSKQATTTAPQPSANEGVLTKAKFDQIQNGMTYDQVVQIIGSKGELMSSTGDKGSQFYTEMYSFKTDGDLGANSSITFQGGKLINKAQFGLGGSSNVTINMAKFEQIQNGMTYEQVQQIVGGEGSVVSESGQKGTEYYTVMIEYKGEGNLGANASLMFQGNKLDNKSQFGLK
jgi:outer membrane protein assembly factor BamE (lipoprotein component of BamABCDE complex)